MYHQKKLFHVWCMINLMLICNASKSSAMAETYMKYKDEHQSVEARVQDLLSRMTLEEKIGQMTQIDRSVASFDVMKNYFIGSVFSGGDSVPFPRATAEDWINMINRFQEGALATPLEIPMFYGIDAVHGHAVVYNSTVFPHNIGLGATRDPDLIRRIGAATALEVRATGIPYIFAPSVAVCRDPRWGRCYESYSEDPQIVQEMTEIIYGLQGEPPKGSQIGFPYVGGRDKVAACAKHYVGDGGTTNGIDKSNTDIDAAGLFNIHMPAYLDSIRKGVTTIMVSYSSWNGKRMHANHDLITDYLKNTIQFKGIVMSDSGAIEMITTLGHANYTYSVLAAIQAGLDMIMVPFNYNEFIDTLNYLVKNNYIHMERIDDAVERILRIKFLMGLFENPMTEFSTVNELGNQAHRDLAREAVRKSLVLLKNGKKGNKPLLPLPKRASKILVAGTHAHNLGYQCGGWTINWHGFVGNNATIGTTILDAVKSTVHPSTEVVYKEEPNKEFVESNNFSHAIIVVGELPYAEVDGDSQTLTMIEPGPTVISNVCGAVKCMVVVISGRPIVIEPYIASIDALVAAWLPGTEGQGVSDMLFGDFEFTGKLSRTWFRNVDQLPMNVGDSYYDPLYPFGFGLTINKICLSESELKVQYD
ncbi:Beta-glucosidase BoGH3B [Bienertia sinuspersici]